MAKNTLGFGIIGCGVISAWHAKAISGVANAKLVAAADVIPERASALAAKWKCEPCPTVAALLKRPDVDIVTIGTPSGTHAELGIEAARAGKHVITEKPIDVTLEKADRLINECQKAGVKLSVVSQFRFQDAIQQALKAVKAGRFGILTNASAYTRWFRSQNYYDSESWRGTKALDGGGCLMNQGIHALDQVILLAGPIKSVRAMTATLAHTIEVEDVAVAAIKFMNGAVGHFVGSTAAYPGQANRVEIHGYKGTACVDLGGKVSNTGDSFADLDGNIRVWEFEDEKGPAGMWGRDVEELPVPRVEISDPDAVNSDNHRRQFEDVVQAVLANREPSVSGAAGRYALKVITAIYESARTGREVEVA